MKMQCSCNKNAFTNFSKLRRSWSDCKSITVLPCDNIFIHWGLLSSILALQFASPGLRLWNPFPPFCYPEFCKIIKRFVRHLISHAYLGDVAFDIRCAMLEMSSQLSCGDTSHVSAWLTYLTVALIKSKISQTEKVTNHRHPKVS